MAVISGLGVLRQGEYHKFKASLGSLRLYFQKQASKQTETQTKYENRINALKMEGSLCFPTSAERFPTSQGPVLRRGLRSRQVP